MDDDPVRRKHYRDGLQWNAARVTPFLSRAEKYDNSTERPFKYANWRTGYAWQDQPTQAVANKVAGTGNKKILGRRKGFERSHVTTPLSACAIIAYAQDVSQREAVAEVLRHYDYSTINISEFFLAELAWYAYDL